MGTSFPEKSSVHPLSEGTTRETSEIEESSNVIKASSLYSEIAVSPKIEESVTSDGRFNDLFLLLPPLRFGRKMSKEERRSVSRPVSIDSLKCPSNALLRGAGDKLVLDLPELRYVLSQLLVDAACDRPLARKCTLFLHTIPERYGDNDLEFELDEALTRVIELLCQQIAQEQYIAIRVSSYHTSMRVARERRDTEDALRGREGEIVAELEQFLHFVNERRSQLVS